MSSARRSASAPDGEPAQHAGDVAEVGLVPVEGIWTEKVLEEIDDGRTEVDEGDVGADAVSEAGVGGVAVETHENFRPCVTFMLAVRGAFEGVSQTFLRFP